MLATKNRFRPGAVSVAFRRLAEVNAAGHSRPDGAVEEACVRRSFSKATKTKTVK